MTYIQITFSTTSNHAEGIADALTELDALAVTLEDGEDHPLFQLAPQETPLWETVCIKALFQNTVSPDMIASQLNQLLALKTPLNYHSDIIEEQDWVRITQQHFKPQCYADHLWICPSWHDDPVAGAIVHIDPGLAFGTGTHPTTSLCLNWLAHNPPKNKIVIDYGCGSGILALAAATLSAHMVYATDHDEQALTATINNAKLNTHIHNTQLLVCTPELMPHIKADVIIANILSGPLMSLEPVLFSLIKPSGMLILSGLLEAEIPMMLAIYETHFDVTDITTQDEWCRISLKAP